MSLRVKSVVSAVCLLGAASGCLDEIKDELPGASSSEGGVMMPPDNGDGGALCTGACCPPAGSMSCYPGGDNSIPGAECLATRDNRGKDHWQMRTVWQRPILPAIGADDQTYNFILPKQTLNSEACNNPNSQSGFIELTDWDRTNPDITQQTLRIGFADFVPNDSADQALQDGLCMLDFTWSDPDNGQTDPIHIAPAVLHRVNKDFQIDDAFRTMYKDAAEGVFFYDDATGYQHSYVSKVYVIIFETAPVGDTPGNIIVLTQHEVEAKGIANAPDDPNCFGVYRAGKLDQTNCQPISQTSPPFGCVTETAEPFAGGKEIETPTTTCGPGAGQGQVASYYLITELDKSWVQITGQSNLLTYYGPAAAVTDGWVTMTQKRFELGDKWKAGDRPHGDWCSTTNAPATATCFDAYRNFTIAALSAANVKATTCSTTSH